MSTKCVTSGLISGAGDMVCQYLTSDDDDVWDLVRTARFVLLGTCLVGPAVHTWYGALNRHLPGATLRATLQRTFFDQAVFAPAFLPLWVACNMTLEGRRPRDVQAALRADYPNLLVANWALWTPAQLVTFGLVPPKFQVLFSNMVGFVWNVYLSYKSAALSSSVRTEHEGN